jgi:hypothetical protein
LIIKYVIIIIFGFHSEDDKWVILTQLIRAGESKAKWSKRSFKVKKLLCLVLLYVTGFAVSAQTLYDFVPFGNSDEETFSKGHTFFQRQHPDFHNAGDLPSRVAEVIRSQLRYHNLNVGDIYIAYIIYGSSYYIVYLRITNALERRWTYYAFVGG